MAGTSNFQIIGLERAIQKIKETTGKTEEELKRTVKQAAYRVEELAKEKCPYVTGELRRSINPRPDGSAYIWLVGTGKEYAAPVENRKPYLQPAAAQMLKEFPEFITATLERVT